MLFITVALIVGLAALALWRALHRRRARRRADTSDRFDPRAIEVLPPREQVITAAAALRNALAARFGPAWQARTTEEILAAPELNAIVTGTSADAVAQLLRLADRAKFSEAASAPDDYGGPWVSLVAELLAAWEPSAGARSNMSGK
jgi:hypothetical protein